MLYCDICNQTIPEGDEQYHLTNKHPIHYQELLQEWIERHIFECERDPKEEALTVGERNPTLR